MWKVRHQNNNETWSTAVMLSIKSDTRRVCVGVGSCVCVCKAHTCGTDRRGGACRHRRSLALRWAGSLRFIHLLRQKRALKTPWAEMNIEPPKRAKNEKTKRKIAETENKRPDRLSRGRDSVMVTALSMNYEATRQSDGKFQLWKRTVMGNSNHLQKNHLYLPLPEKEMKKSLFTVGKYLAEGSQEQREAHLSHWELFPSLSAWTFLWGSQHAERREKQPPGEKKTNNMYKKH